MKSLVCSHNIRDKGIYVYSKTLIIYSFVGLEPKIEDPTRTIVLPRVI